LSCDAEMRRRRRVIAVALRRVDCTSIAGSLAQFEVPEPDEKNPGFPGSGRLSPTSPPQMPVGSSNSKHPAERQTTEVEEAYHNLYRGIVRGLWDKKGAPRYLSEGLLTIRSKFWGGPATE
jgi:hypothetical protein